MINSRVRIICSEEEYDGLEGIVVLEEDETVEILLNTGVHITLLSTCVEILDTELEEEPVIYDEVEETEPEIVDFVFGDNLTEEQVHTYILLDTHVENLYKNIDYEKLSINEIMDFNSFSIVKKTFQNIFKEQMFLAENDWNEIEKLIDISSVHVYSIKDYDTQIIEYLRSFYLNLIKTIKSC